MKFLDYLFWSLYNRFCKKKYSYPYSDATIALGVIVALIAMVFFDIVPNAVRAEFSKKSIYAYLYYGIYALVFSLPFRLIFPKKKIEKLSFTEEELKKYKIIFRYIMLSLLSLYIIRVWYCW